jgi:hypothetical protein
LPKTDLDTFKAYVRTRILKIEEVVKRRKKCQRNDPRLVSRTSTTLPGGGGLGRSHLEQGGTLIRDEQRHQKQHLGG